MLGTSFGPVDLLTKFPGFVFSVIFHVPLDQQSGWFVLFRSQAIPRLFSLFWASSKVFFESSNRLLRITPFRTCIWLQPSKRPRDTGQFSEQLRKVVMPETLVYLFWLTFSRYSEFGPILFQVLLVGHQVKKQHYVIVMTNKLMAHITLRISLQRLWFCTSFLDPLGPLGSIGGRNDCQLPLPLDISQRFSKLRMSQNSLVIYNSIEIPWNFGKRQAPLFQGHVKVLEGDGFQSSSLHRFLAHQVEPFFSVRQYPATQSRHKTEVLVVKCCEFLWPGLSFHYWSAWKQQKVSCIRWCWYTIWHNCW